MPADTIPLLIISGPVGVGKTTVGHELSVQLSDAAIAHTFVDLDALAYTFPRPPDDPFGSRLAHANLAALWANARAVGAKNLVVARVVETPAGVADIVQAVPGAAPIVCQLSAGDASLRARVATREIGSSHDWHADRAIELARSLAAASPADFIVDTDARPVADIAGEVLSRVDWRR